MSARRWCSRRPAIRCSAPVAMHIFAPDEGNIHLMEVVATPEQKERWLRPLARGDIRSCFCMTEPAPGAGSDPSALNTTAVQDGNHWVINGDQVVHHRRGWRGLRHHHGEGRGRRRDDVPGRHGSAGHRDRAHDGQPGPGVRRRARRGAVQRSARAGQRHPGRARQGLPLRAGAAGAGAADALHALARRGAARARHRRGVCRPRARCSARSW